MTRQMKNYTMTRTINIDGQPVEYELEYKKVKNMNLRIRKDGSIYVSANRYISRQQAPLMNAAITVVPGTPVTLMN